MFKLRRAAIAAAALVAATVIAYAAGNWSTLPVIGGAAFCASNVSGVTLPAGQGPYGVVPGSTQGTGSGICGQTVPAGPPSLTGAEKFPADTGAAGGASPATAVVTTCQMGAGAYALVSPPTPGNATIPNQVCYYIVHSTGTISSAVLTLPSLPLDGQLLRVATDQTITTLTVQGAAGQTVIGAPTSGSIGNVGSWIWDAATSTWYKF